MGWPYGQPPHSLGDHETRVPPPITTNPIVDDYLDSFKSTGNFHAASGNKTQHLDLLKHQSQLQRAFETLHAVLPAELGEDAQQALDASRQSLAVIKDQLIRNLGVDPTSTAPSARSAQIAQRVFEITELADMILSYLAAKDLFEVVKVNKWLAVAVQESSLIQTKLGLKSGDWKGWRSNFAKYTSRDYCSTFELLPNFVCDLVDPWSLSGREGPNESQGTFVFVEFGTSDFPWRSKLPKVGPRGRAMLICQPPILEMVAETNCCTFHGPEAYDEIGLHPPHTLRVLDELGLPPPPALPTVRSASGITVGDLLSAAEDIIREHRHCPYADLWHHDDDTAEVRVIVTFRGPLRIESPRKTMTKIGHVQPSRCPQGQRSPTLNQLHDLTPLGRYIKAKRAAVLKRGAIPTPSQFEAMLLSEVGSSTAHRATGWLELDNGSTNAPDQDEHQGREAAR